MIASPPRQHVLLVGIDAYQNVDPLYGCVNDVDALEAVFLDRLHVDPSTITKLVAPHNNSVRTPRMREGVPTSENLRQAFQALDSDQVRPGDRIFIHYSGHGTSVPSRLTRCMREALVPVDARAGGELLYDDELNALLFRIAERSKDLTVVLDGCCSAGVTRSALSFGKPTIRSCHFDGPYESMTHVAHRGARAPGKLFAALDPSDPGFVVVASAQSSDAAHETRDARGVRHGAFTAALLDLVAREPDDQLLELRWVDVWQGLQARVNTAFPAQHPCLMGRSERRVFGGSFRPRDPGLPITLVNGSYEIHSGSLAGLSVGARVAVYGAAPSFFEPLHSPLDVAARQGVLRIEHVTLDTAIAVPEGRTIALEKGARGRIVQPGPREKLVIGMDPFDAHVARFLEQEALVAVVSLAEPGAHVVEAVVGLSPDGSWWLGDEVFGPDAPLARIPKGDLAALSRVVGHYASYNQPLRLVRRSAEAAETLRLRVLDATEVAKIQPKDLHDPALPEVDPDEEGVCRYRLREGQPVCFSVENRGTRAMYTHLLNCTAGGRVEVLGPTALEIAPQRRQTFWRGGRLGRAFSCGISKGRAFNIDRLVIVGSTSARVEVQSLSLRDTFVDALSIQRRDVATRDENHVWRAAMVTVRIVRV